MDDHQPTGIGVEDLPAIYREGYDHAIEAARRLYDPATEWEAFRDYLWHAVTRVFGLEIDEPWPEELAARRGDGGA